MTERAADGGPNNRPADSLLLELGGEIRRVAQNVTQLSADFGPVAGYVAEMYPKVADQGNKLAELEGKLEGLLANPEPQNPQIDWPNMLAEDAEKNWDDLAEWIANTLVPWYAVTRKQLPDCWPLHNPAVVQLSWLRVAYVGAYQPTAHPSNAAEWNTRWIGAAIRNLERTISPAWCRPGQHLQYKPDQPKSPSAPYANPASRQPGWTGQQPPAGGAARPNRGEEEQLAESHHWAAAWQQAKAADIGWRREREEAAARTTKPTQPPTSPAGPPPIQQ